jgi:hypothetical protein
MLLLSAAPRSLTRRRPGSRPRTGGGPHLEALEDRSLLALVTLSGAGVGLQPAVVSGSVLPVANGGVALTNLLPVTLPVPVLPNIPLPPVGLGTLLGSNNPTPTAPAPQGASAGGTALASLGPAGGSVALPTDLTRAVAASSTPRPAAPVVPAQAAGAPRSNVVPDPTLSATVTYLLASPGALTGVRFGTFTSSGAGSAWAGEPTPATADPGRTGDLRPEPGPGAAPVSASAGLGDELLEAFVPAPPEPDLLPEQEPIGNDLALALLTGGRPDLLPQQGSEVSPVATLLPGDGAYEGGTLRTRAGADEGGLSGLLIGPMHHQGAGPARTDALASLSVQATPAGDPARPGDRRLRAILVGGTVVLGLVMRAAWEWSRRRAEPGPEAPRGGRPAADTLPSG